MAMALSCPSLLPLLRVYLRLLAGRAVTRDAAADSLMIFTDFADFLGDHTFSSSERIWVTGYVTAAFTMITTIAVGKFKVISRARLGLERPYVVGIPGTLHGR